MAIELTINNETHQLDIPAEMPLLWAIRDYLQYTGTKYGCGRSLCGACTVHVDGQPMRSCTTPVSAVANKQITTIEGLDSRPGRAVQRAWEKLAVVQCGYCQSGQIMSAAALLAANPQPDAAAIDRAMTGNICRCATYVRIRAAIRDAADTLAGEG